MQFVKNNNTFLVRLEKGEKLIEKLTELSKVNNILSGVFYGIGSVSGAELAFYNLREKEYESKKFDRSLEIASLIGNISQVKNAPFLHCHVVLSDSNFVCFGGHLKEAEVGATCEIYLLDFGINIERKHDEEIGLKLLDCKM